MKQARRIANITNDWQKALAAARVSKTGKLDWLGMEATLRAYIRQTKNADLDEIVAVFTKGGNEL